MIRLFRVTMVCISVLFATALLGACGDGGSSGGSGKSNADLLKEAAANMNTLKSYHLDMDVNQGDFPVKMNGDFDVAGDRASLGMSFGGKTNYLIKIGNDSYMSLDEGKTYQPSSLKTSFKLWEGVKPEDIDKAKDALKDVSPSTESLDGGETRHITANGKDFPALTSGVAPGAIEGTMEFWVSTDARPLVRQMKVDGKSGDDAITGTIKWSKFDEKFSIEAPAVAPTATPFVIPTPTPLSASDCKPVPASEGITIGKPCYLAVYDELKGYSWSAEGFKADEKVFTNLTNPDGKTVLAGTEMADSTGHVSYQMDGWGMSDLIEGQYTQTVEGFDSGHKVEGYFYFVINQ